MSGEDITIIRLEFIQSADGSVCARAEAGNGQRWISNPEDVAAAINGPSGAALAARAALQGPAYLVVGCQPIEFGAEIPREVLR